MQPPARFAEFGPQMAATASGSDTSGKVYERSCWRHFPSRRPARESKAKTRVDHRNSEEAALVRRVQARDEMAFREIVERYQAKVFSIIYGILRNHNDAEDIAQQVFAKIYFSIHELRFSQFAAHLDLQDHGQRMLRLPAQEARPQAGLRERFFRRGRPAHAEQRDRHRHKRRPWIRSWRKETW